jgi:sugar (pentulose or hexulose) kinase
MRFLGIDLGTASLKLATVDEDGHERAFASAAYGSPWMNPSARAGWLGLGPGDTRGTMMRAVFEGVAFAWSWHAVDLAALAPSETRVASPSNDADLAYRHTCFIDLYQRNANWF